MPLLGGWLSLAANALPPVFPVRKDRAPGLPRFYRVTLKVALPLLEL